MDGRPVRIFVGHDGSVVVESTHSCQIHQLINGRDWVSQPGCHDRWHGTTVEFASGHDQAVRTLRRKETYQFGRGEYHAKHRRLAIHEWSVSGSCINLRFGILMHETTSYSFSFSRNILLHESCFKLSFSSSNVWSTLASISCALTGRPSRLLIGRCLSCLL